VDATKTDFAARNYAKAWKEYEEEAVRIHQKLTNKMPTEATMTGLHASMNQKKDEAALGIINQAGEKEENCAKLPLQSLNSYVERIIAHEKKIQAASHPE
jgi:hypothetical protein